MKYRLDLYCSLTGKRKYWRYKKFKLPPFDRFKGKPTKVIPYMQQFDRAYFYDEPYLKETGIYFNLQNLRICKI